MTRFVLLIILVLSAGVFGAGVSIRPRLSSWPQEPSVPPEGEKPWEAGKRRRQDEVGGVPADVLARQRLGKADIPAIEEAAKTAEKEASEAAEPLVAREFHAQGRILRVPGDHPKIQAALDAARAGDTVLVAAGTYHEQVVVTDGVKLASDNGEDGDDLVPLAGARLQLPRRALRTILDGSGSKPSSRGMIDFEPGAGRKTVVDGFTVQNLPAQDHHQPGHAHAVNVRGSSPVVMNCLIRNNGSTGVGNHVVFHDQGRPIKERDFREANVKHAAAAVIWRNVIHGNFGLGIGSNHLSAPFILGNEVFGNDDSALGEPTPGIGCQHGAAPVVIGNLVHDNMGGGILGKVGEAQGKHPIDRPTHPRIEANVVFDNGPKRPGIACDGAGSEAAPVRIARNCVYRAGWTGVALSRGSTGLVEDNRVLGSGAPGVAIEASLALKLNRNEVAESKGAGFVIGDGAVVREMAGNLAEANAGPRFALHGGTIALPKPDR